MSLKTLSITNSNWAQSPSEYIEPAHTKFIKNQRFAKQIKCVSKWNNKWSKTRMKRKFNATSSPFFFFSKNIFYSFPLFFTLLFYTRSRWANSNSNSEFEICVQKKRKKSISFYSVALEKSRRRAAHEISFSLFVEWASNCSQS